MEQVVAGDEEAEAAGRDAQAGPSSMDTDETIMQPMFSLDEAPATRAEGVGSSSPMEDFHSLLQQGQAEKALNGLASIVITLVARSLGHRWAGQNPHGVTN